MKYDLFNWPPVQIVPHLLQHLHRQLRQENHPFPYDSHCQLREGQAVLSQISPRIAASSVVFSSIIGHKKHNAGTQN